MIVIEQATLYYKQGSADKVYRVTLQEVVHDTFQTIIEYGRRGKPLRRQVAYEGDSFDTAMKTFRKKVHAKQLKGYSEDELAEVSQTLATDFPTTGYFPQLATVVALDELPDMIRGWNRQVHLQTKHDGERRIVSISPEGEVAASNRRGLGVAISPRVEAELQGINKLIGGFTIDCEDMGDQLIIFDVLSWQGNDICHKPFAERMLHIMCGLIYDYGDPGHEDDPLLIDPGSIANSEQGILAFASYARHNNEEGIILRDPNAEYTIGRPNSGGTLRKYKFVESATVVVGEINTHARSVKVFVRGDEIKDESYPSWEGHEMGNVTIPPNYDVPNVGDLVEVEYLYAYPDGGKLYEPQYKGVREDIELPDEYKSLKFKK